MEQVTNINNSDKTESASDSGDESSKDSPVQISHSDAEDNIVVVTKVGDMVTDKDFINNDEIIGNNVNEIKVSNTGNNLSVGVSNNDEQNVMSNLNGPQNDNSTVEVKEAGTLEQEKSSDINIPPAVAHHVDQDDLLSQSGNDFINVTYEN